MLGQVTATTLDIPEPAIVDLRERLERTRFPDQAPGPAWAYGADLDYIRDLVDPFSFCQNTRRPPEVDVGGGAIIDALVVAAVVVVGDECRDLGFEIAGQEVIFQQDAVLEGLVPTLDLALGHRMIGRAAEVFDIAAPSHLARSPAT